MYAKVLFDNKSINCRVVLSHDNGDVIKQKDFTKVSSLVNYCNEHRIEIPIGNCQTVDEIPDFDCKEEN